MVEQICLGYMTTPLRRSKVVWCIIGMLLLYIIAILRVIKKTHHFLNNCWLLTSILHTLSHLMSQQLYEINIIILIL